MGQGDPGSEHQGAVRPARISIVPVRRNRPHGLVKLTTVVDGNNRRLVCFDLHDEAVKALQELHLISRRRRPRSTNYKPVEDLDEHSIYISKSLPAETKRALRSIIARRGQVEFRRGLLQAYGGRCAVTGCAEVQVLEAAHIRNFSRRGRYEVGNGILLRADWHTLFDLGMWAIHPKTHRIIVSTDLRDSSYSKLEGRRISLPQDPKCAPSDLELDRRYRDFKKRRA
jgi:putative restriction endonuclease